MSTSRFLAVIGAGRRSVTPRKSKAEPSMDEMRFAVGALFPEAEYVVLSPMESLPGNHIMVGTVTVHVSGSPDGVGRIGSKFYEWGVARRVAVTDPVKPGRDRLFGSIGPHSHVPPPTPPSPCPDPAEPGRDGPARSQPQPAPVLSQSYPDRALAICHRLGNCSLIGTAGRTTDGKPPNCTCRTHEDLEALLVQAAEVVSLEAKLPRARDRQSLCNAIGIYWQRHVKTTGDRRWNTDQIADLIESLDRGACMMRLEQAERLLRDAMKEGDLPLARYPALPDFLAMIAATLDRARQGRASS